VNRDLGPLFAPRSIAVAGASTDPASWGYWLAQAAVEGADRRPVHLVNPRGGELFGRPLRASLRELDGEADLVVVAVPERALEDTIDAALEIGARSIVVITSGLGERDDSGRVRELALRARVRAAGALMLGPNCIGVFDAAANLRISSNEYPSGPIGLISQSGNLSLEIGLLLGRVGLGLSRFASVGNQADVTLPDLLEHLAEHETTKAIAVYVEDVADGRAFVTAARAAGHRKPVVVLAAGTSEAGRRGAASHTGALVSDQAVLRAACEAAGALLVESPGALVDALHALVCSPLPRGRRVAVIGDGGGHGAVCADVLTANGLSVPELSTALVAKLDAALPPHGGIANPIDLIGVGDPELNAFSTAARIVLESGEVDAVAVTGYFGGYALYSDAYGASEPAEGGRLAALQTSTGSPVLAHSMYAPDGGGDSLRAAGLAVYERTEQAARALAALASLAEARETPAPLALPAPAAPLAAPVGYLEARELLVAAGLPYPEGAAALDAGGVVAAANRLALYPVTLKAVDATLVHKSDRGGVRVGLPDAASLHAAALELERTLAPALLFVERTADTVDGVELIVGARQDARFGPLVLVGLGGTLVEVLDDTALALAPIDDGAARRLLLSLRGAALLRGVRGRPPIDLDAAAAAVASISLVAAAHPEIGELEVNPLLVTPSGACALDARAILQFAEEDPAP
jgi:acetate---CoA ligase (ADP-forming)